MLEENIDNILLDTSLGKDFLNMTLFSQELRPAIDKWDPTKWKLVCKAEEIINWLKKKLTESRRVSLPAIYLKEDLISRITTTPVSEKKKNRKSKKRERKEKKK